MARRYNNTSLRSLTYRLRKFKPILDECLRDVIEEHEKEIVDMIRSQLWSGFNGYEENIIPPYADRTIKRKISKGQPTDRVTLKDTGAFYQSLSIEFDNDGFRVVSDDKKAVHLLSRYGEDVLRLANKNLKELLTQYIRPILGERLKEYLSND